MLQFILLKREYTSNSGVLHYVHIPSINQDRTDVVDVVDKLERLSFQKLVTP